jgi:hypothetical protein
LVRTITDIGDNLRKNDVDAARRNAGRGVPASPGLRAGGSQNLRGGTIILGASFEVLDAKYFPYCGYET